LLPAAAQVVAAGTAQAIGITEGRRRSGLFLLVCGLMGVIVPVEIAADSEMFVSRTIMGIPPHYALTAMTLALAVLTDLRYYQRVVARPLLAVGLACLMSMLVIGVARHGLGSQLVRSDIYIVRWFLVGFILMRLAIAAGMLRPFLLFSATVILLTAFGIDFKNTEAGAIDTAIKRVVSSNLWPVINLGMIMIGLLITVTWPRAWYYGAIGLCAFGFLIFAGTIRTSTRSNFTAQAICLVLSLVALSRDPRMRGHRRGLQRAVTIVVVLAVTYLGYQLISGNFLSDYSQISKRFTEAQQETRFGASRVDEAVGMVESLSPSEWVFGMGLGGMFYSTLNFWANVPHIAVLGALQKGGTVIFILVLLFVYIAPSFAFVKQLTLPRRTSPLPPPILVVGPSLLAWCALTCISGGVDPGSFLGLGGLTALWIQLVDDDKVFQIDRSGHTSTAAAPYPYGTALGPVGAS
jgi:hypothetical protein